MTMPNLLKTTACAALLALAAFAGSTRTAAAATYETHCYGDDCYRVRCDNLGFDCRRIENLGHVGYVRSRDRLMCDAYGDTCHWVRTRAYDYDDDDNFPD